MSKAPDGNDEEETEAKKSASDASVNAFNSHQEQDGSGPNERTGDTDEKPDGTVLDSAPSSPSSSVEVGVCRFVEKGNIYSLRIQITLDYPNAPPERAFQSRSYSTAQDAVDLHSGPSGIQTPVVPEGRRDSRDQKPPFAQNTQDDRNDANDVNGGQSIQNWQNPGAFNSMMPISNGMNPAMYMQMQFMG